MPVLKLRGHNKDKEVEFELKYLLSLSLQERFRMMLNKTKEMRELAKRHEHRGATQILKRA